MFNSIQDKKELLLPKETPNPINKPHSDKNLKKTIIDENKESQINHKSDKVVRANNTRKSIKLKSLSGIKYSLIGPDQEINSLREKFFQMLKKDEETQIKTPMQKMTLKIIKYSWCYLLTFICIYIIRTINLIFLGHIDKENNLKNINVLLIGYFYLDIFGTIFCIGTMQAFEFFGSKFYISKQYDLFMDIYNIAKICCMLIFLIIILPFSFCSEFFLKRLGIEDTMAFHTSQYIKINLISYAFTILHILNTKFLQIIGCHLIAMGIHLISLVIHIISCLYFIYNFQLGFFGAAISSGISAFTSYMMTSVYVYLFYPKRSADTYVFSIDSDLLNTTKFYIYCRFGFINSFFFTLQDASLEIIVVLSYYIDNINFTSSAIALNYVSLLYHFIVGFSVMIMNRIYKYMINKKIQKTKNFMKNLMILIFIIAGIVSIINFLFGYYIGYLYLDNSEVNENFAFLVRIYSFIIFFDWGNSLFVYFLKGFNQHTNSRIISNLALIFIFIPVGILLSFTFKLGFMGFWYSVWAFMIIFCLIHGTYLYSIDLNRDQDKIVNSLKNYEESEDIFFK